MVQDILLCFASRIASLFQHPSWSSASKSSEDNSVESQHRIATSADPKEMWVVCLMTAKSRATMSSPLIRSSKLTVKEVLKAYSKEGPQSLQPLRSSKLTEKEALKAYSQAGPQSLQPSRSSKLTAKEFIRAHNLRGPQSSQLKRSSKLTAKQVLKAYSQGVHQSSQLKRSSGLTT
ncbi:hypothetical protein BgiBS90_017544 [Biomphalaria glabrata]|nr:hypothetical protein BgiBS90_017544 [Biomphalaria glabrata]